MITAFGELHSNASMFGGIESVSFKIKYKSLEKRARRVFESLKIGHEDKYAYVIVRNDLTNAQKCVQAVHASVEKLKDSLHPSVIVVVVKNEKKLRNVMRQLSELDIDYSIFMEPMLNGEMTALCTEAICDTNKRQFLQKFQLMT